MKQTLLLLFFMPFGLLAADIPVIDQPGSKREVSYAAQGEDATSAFYYFFYRVAGEESLSKVRVLWNGGAQNNPTITDYYLDSSITVVERSAERRDLPILEKGKDVSFKILREHTIKSLADGTDATPASSLSADDQKTLSSLVSILALHRKPLRKTSR